MFLKLCSRAGAAALATAVLALSASLAAQTAAAKPPAQKSLAAPADALPPAREIIDRHVKAIGGREAVLAHSSTHATGTFAVAASGMAGTVDIYGAAKPDRTLLRITIPGLGQIVSGFDGTHGWSTSPLTGPMLQEGKELEQSKFDADFYGELRDPARFASITTVEKAAFEGRPCYKVRLARKDGSEDFDFYDVATGLKAGSVNTRETPMGTVTITSSESDYKKFGKLLMPTTIKQRTMSIEQTITIATVEFDAVPPGTFDLPAEIKALIK
jgi:hypothetical protein